MAEKKRYVVRIGKETGIFTERSQVQPLVSGFAGAKYKSFKSEVDAEEALQNGREEYYQAEKKRFERDLPFVKKSIAVDAACSSATGEMEYQGIDLESQKVIFSFKSKTGTNNIGEFLAIVHALSYLEKEKKSDFFVYSDSKIAMNRVLQGKCKTNFVSNDENKELFVLIKRAENWLAQHPGERNLLKRKTSERGENPADFGRK
jgi:caulimovirus viroplasmin